MEYEISDISPVRKKIAITIPAEEVNQTIGKIVNKYKTDLKLDGFRKGKVPTAVIENRLHNVIYEEAKEFLVNKSIKEIFSSSKLEPLTNVEESGIDHSLAKNNSFQFGVEFDVAPEFSLPHYEGLEADQEKFQENEAEISKIIDKIRREKAQWIVPSDRRFAKDGDKVNINYKTFEDGQLVEHLQTENFNLEIGAGESLTEFENIVKSVPVGDTGSGTLTFPPDFFSPSMAGKTVKMEVVLNSIREAVLPPLNDDFANKMGFTTLEEFKEHIRRIYKKNKESFSKAETQKMLLDRLVQGMTFELPSSIVELETRYILADLASMLEKQGRELASTGKSLDELKIEARPRAERNTRNLIFLLAVAKKEGLTISDKELMTQLLSLAYQTGIDFRKLREDYEKSGMIFQLRDKMLADKAMDLIYEKAKINFIEKTSQNGNASDSSEHDVQQEA